MSLAERAITSMRQTSRPYQPADDVARAVRSELGTAIAEIDALYAEPIVADRVDRLLSAEFRCARLEARLAVLGGPARIGRSLVELRRLVASLVDEIDDEAARRGASVELVCLGPTVELWLDPVLFAELVRCVLDGIVASLPRGAHAALRISTEVGFTTVDFPAALSSASRRVFAHLAQHLDLGFDHSEEAIRVFVPHAELELERDEFGYPRRRWIFPPPTAA
jgi:hypothetical protein